VTVSRINTLLVTPLGTKKLSSSTMADGKGNLSEIDSRNIIATKPEELPEESWKAVEEFQRALQEHWKAFEEELNAVEEKEMQALLSCFKKDRQGGVTQIQGVILPSVECKSIKIPGVKLNITLPPVTSYVFSGEEVAHMVDQTVSASLANRLQKIIDGSIDNQLESALDSKVHSAMLRVNDETDKNKLNLLNLMLHRLSLIFSITILKITTVTLARSRSVVF
jgi:hypothetical protein